MELPFKFIVLSIFRFLDDRDMALVIKRSTLTKYMVCLIRILSTSFDDFKDIASNFNFDEELDFFIHEYNYYLIDNGDNNIVFDYENIEELGNLIDDAGLESDENIIDVVEDVMYNEFSLIEILGVKVDKDLYHVLLNNEHEIERLYNYLGKTTDSQEKEKTIKKIKHKRTISDIIFTNMNTQFDYLKCYDLLVYADDYNDKHDEGFFNLVVTYEEDSLLANGAIWRSLFDNDINSLSMFALRDKMEKFIADKDTPSLEINMSELNFYLLYLNLLDREIGLNFNYALREELITVKYRLMYVLDSLYGVRTFLSYDEPVVSFKEDNYNFIREIVYKLIEEVLDTIDSEYYITTQSGKNVKDIITYFYSTLEKLFVETYYSLTKDKGVIEAIKGNESFEKNKISSSFFDEIINKPKKRIK